LCTRGGRIAHRRAAPCGRRTLSRQNPAPGPRFSSPRSRPLHSTPRGPFVAEVPATACGA
jgi:hypothetical protein